ncbi:MAG TPA: biopolymer transporter ExbD [Thioalkalivibrio sp.]|nr:biopolymer transporter ExbD [Thioalkalivibrio sp.]
MPRRRHYKRHSDQADLDVTTFLNLMVVLIPFLLITAVFSRITIQELNVPDAAAGGSQADEPLVTIEVIVRQDKLEISNGRAVTASIALVDGEHDISMLSAHLLDLKKRHADKEDAVLLIEPDVEYDTIIQVMDAVKAAEIEVEDEHEVERIVLFPKLSVGDAP